MKKQARFFKALADETRLQILALLSWRGELCVCDIMTVLGLTQSKVSRHLRYLTQAGILEDERRGIWVSYRIVNDLPSLEAGLISAMREHFAAPEYAELKERLTTWLAKKGGEPLCACKRTSKKEEVR